MNTTKHKLWVLALFLVAIHLAQVLPKAVNRFSEKPVFFSESGVVHPLLETPNQLAENSEPFQLVSVAHAQVPPTPVKISSLTQVATAPNNALLMLTIPGVTNYVITIANFKTDLATTFGTNTVVLSNAFVVSLNVLSNYVNNLIATNSSQFQSNIMVAWTNFANWLLVSNNANIGGDTYVSGTVYANGFFATNDSHFKNIYVSGTAFISHAVVTNEISVDEVDTDTVVVTNYVQVPVIYVSGTGYFSNIVVTNLTFPTNWSVVLSGTNTYIEVTTTNGTNFYTVNANDTATALFVTNLTVQSITVNSNAYVSNFFAYNSYMTNVTIISNANIKGSVFISQTNFINYLVVSNLSYFGGNIEVAGTGFFDSIYVTNQSLLHGAALSFSSSASNNPANNELPTAQWVRSLFSSGLILYVSTNIFTAATNTDEPHVVHEYTNQIPPTASRYYSTVNAGDYIGSVVPTNQFLFLQGPVVVTAYLQRTNGVGSPTVSLHPELYYSYDRTNWTGDWVAGDQTIASGTNMYQWVITFPAITSTNSTGFWIERRFKVATATGATHPDVVVHIGTNYLSGTNSAAHIDINGVNSSFIGPQIPNWSVVISGTNTLVEVTTTNNTNFYKVNSTATGGGSITNIGVLGTNIAYAAINPMDFSSPWNDYQMTNVMASHMTNWITNLTQGASVSLSIIGTNEYTNWNVYFYWPPYATVTWLSITNGAPVTTITSNKLQFYSFLVRTNDTQTNVIASFKEQP